MTTAATFAVHSPRDGRLLAELAATPVDRVSERVLAARASAIGWAGLDIKERVRRLRAIRDAWLEKGPELARILMDEGGKSEAEALMSEVVPSVDLFDYWLKAAPGFLAPERIALSPLNFPGKRGVIHYEPRGVVALVTPWNYPASIPLRVLVPALLAGNAVVWKPSEFGALTGRFIHGLFTPHLPPGLLQLVEGAGDVGEALIDAPVDAISFVGSAAVGKRIATRAAPRLIPVSLELGGKNAAIVLEGADVERAAAGIVWGAFGNAGQNCAAVSRCFVVREVAERFLQSVERNAERIRVGSGGAELFDVGPLINARQLDRAVMHADEAKSSGARLLADGGRVEAPGNWFAPRIVLSPAPELLMSREESFAPLLGITVVADEAEAMARAGEGDYGLSASIWVGDTTRGERLARGLNVGTVTINNTSFTPVIPNAPWSGRGLSGHGATNSHRALAELVQPKFVLAEQGRESELWWFPHDATMRDLGRTLLQFLDRRITRKLAALPQLLQRLMARKKRLQNPAEENR
jgi:acyl-CoA reductase-like NAD-dependent aldehyde dehydrogenase